jgi:hypothetical protein
MPGGGGAELLDELRTRHFETPSLIFMTGFADLELEDAFAGGAEAMISKPFDREELLALVQRVLIPREARWTGNPKDEIVLDFSLNLELPGLKAAGDAGLFRIGRGGFFLSLKDPLMWQGAKVAYHLSFRDEGIQLKGQGTVRWTLSEGSNGRLQGCGMEFDYMDEANRKQIQHYIDTHKMVAYIPKE